MGNHFTWFDLIPDIFHAGHDHAYTMAAIFATLMVVLLSVTANVSLGRGEAAIAPADRFSVKGIFEAVLEFMVDLVRSIMGTHSDHYIPIYAAVFFWILFNNLIGLVPGFTAATANMNAALAMGVCSFIFYNVEGVRHSGFVKYMGHFAGPIPFMAVVIFPIEIVSNFVRPMSLGLRLSVNMTADHLILGTFTHLTKVIIPVVFYGMGTFVSMIQAFVFTLLSIVYVTMATADEH
jgi:F-type H+-transporting ATPase subunit a